MVFSHSHVLNMTFEVMYINHQEKPKTICMHKKKKIIPRTPPINYTLRSQI